MPPDTNGDHIPNFTVVQFAGWGLSDTIRGIRYVERERAVDCTEALTDDVCYERYMDPEPVFTYDGDETVVVPSAVAMGAVSSSTKGVETWYVDMWGYNKQRLKVNRSHASILEVDPLRSALRSIVRKEVVHERFLYATTSVSKPEAYLRLAMHSPVDVLVTDTKGNRITVTGTTTAEEISNSYALTFGEGKYLGVPLDGSEYTVALTGTGEGRFTFELVEERQGTVFQKKTFTDVPVSTSSRAQLTLSTLSQIETLALDSDGDGTVDRIIYPDEYEKPVSFALLKEKVQALSTPAKRMLFYTLRRAEYFAEKEKTKKAVRTLRLFDTQVHFLTKKKLPVWMRISKKEAKEIQKISKALQKKLQGNKK